MTIYLGRATAKQKPMPRVCLADMRGDPWTEAEEREEDARHAEDRAQAQADEDERGGCDEC